MLSSPIASIFSSESKMSSSAKPIRSFNFLKPEGQLGTLDSVQMSLSWERYFLLFDFALTPFLLNLLKGFIFAPIPDAPFLLFLAQ